MKVKSALQPRFFPMLVKFVLQMPVSKVCEENSGVTIKR